MTTLLCLGLGYCARRYVADFGASYSRITGTSRHPEAERHTAARMTEAGKGLFVENDDTVA